MEYYAVEMNSVCLHFGHCQYLIKLLPKVLVIMLKILETQFLNSSIIVDENYYVLK